MKRREFLRYSARVSAASAAVTIGLEYLDEAAGERNSGSRYYASPSGGGNGRSSASPFKVKNFWEVAKSGDTLLMLDGKYTGDDSMINPPQGFKGTPEGLITVRALNDGKVEIDGEGQRRPALLGGNDYFILEGFNAYNAGPRNATVVGLGRSNHNIIRRVCAWDASDGNNDVIGVHHSEHNLLEDCAAWGIARKTYSNSQGGNYTTYRRCFGRWEGCTAVGPKMTYSCFYNSHHITLENCIGTWDARKMPETHQAMGYDGKPFTKWGSGRRTPKTYKDYNVDQPYGVISADNYYPNIKMPRNGPYLYGCIAYVLPSPKLRPFSGMFQIGWGRKRTDGRIENCLAYMHPAVTTAGPAFSLFQFRGRNLTAVGGKTQFKESQIESVRQSDKGDEIVAERGHLLDVPGGATIMHRYENGKLTDKPLWPWPMNQRIIVAMKLAGYDDPVDVTRTVFELGGGRAPDFGAD